MQHRRRARTAVVVAALVAVGGCSDPVEQVSADGDDTSSTVPATDPTTSTTTTAATDDALELTGSPPPDAPSTPECPPPFQPLVPPGDIAFAEFESVAVGPPSPPVLDSDGDGKPDEVVTPPEGGSPTVRRGDGDLVFNRDGLDLNVHSLDDLDGDGRSELLVTHVSVEAPPADRDPWVYVVPGATAVGTHDPADVGIRVARAMATVGDHDGDGVEDLLEYDGDPPTRVLSGASVMAVGVPGDARAVEPLRYVPGTALAHADLGAGTAWITVEMESPTSDRYTIHVVDDTGDRRFTTPPGESPINATLGSVRVYVGDAGSFLMVAPTGRGSTGRSLVWRIDDPCGSHSP